MDRMWALARSRPGLAWTAAAAVTAVLVVVGVNAGNASESHPAAAGPAAAGPAPAGPAAAGPAPAGPAPADDRYLAYFQYLDPGDCIESPADSSARAWLPVVDCSSSHSEEVMGGVYLKAGPWVGTDAVHEAAKKACAPVFTDYVGVGPAESAHQLQTIDPARATWSSGDRWVLCLVEASSVAGSLEGAGS